MCTHGTTLDVRAPCSAHLHICTFANATAMIWQQRTACVCIIHHNAYVCNHPSTWPLYMVTLSTTVCSHRSTWPLSARLCALGIDSCPLAAQTALSYTLLRSTAQAPRSSITCRSPTACHAVVVHDVQLVPVPRDDLSVFLPDTFMDIQACCPPWHHVSHVPMHHEFRGVDVLQKREWTMWCTGTAHTRAFTHIWRARMWRV